MPLNVGDDTEELGSAVVMRFFHCFQLARDAKTGGHCLPASALKKAGDLNECAKLPAEVKEKAISHCATYDKKAVFLG
jgi:hypothetical protein